MVTPRSHPKGPRRDSFAATRLERILLGIVVCVPVPVFALSGLNLPLPGVVERVAAALVPWADAATLDDHVVASALTPRSVVAVNEQSRSRALTGSSRVEPGLARRPGARASMAKVHVAAPDVPTTAGGDTSAPTEPAPAPPAEPPVDEREPDVPTTEPAPDEHTAPVGEPPAPDPPPAVDPPVTPPDKPKPTDAADTRPVDDSDVRPPEPTDEDTKPADDPVKPTPAPTPAEPSEPSRPESTANERADTSTNDDAKT